MQWPLVAISIITYERERELAQVMESLRQFLIYPKLHYVISDDGSSTPYVNQYAAEHVTVLRHAHMGMGGNWNAAIKEAHRRAELVLCLQDDWVLTRPLDLRLGVLLLEQQPEYGMVRYHDIAGHEGMTLKLHEMNVSAVMQGYHDHDHARSPHMLQYFELLPDGCSFGPYSGGAHLRHYGFTRMYGEYPHNQSSSDTEYQYMRSVVKKMRMGYPKIAMFPPFIMSAFRDIGVGHHITGKGAVR